MAWVRAFHLVGIVLWFGALLQVTRLLKTRARSPESTWETLHAIERRTQLFVGFPGLFLTVLTGLTLLFHHPEGTANFMKHGWFHAKLTAVIIAIVVDVLVFVTIRQSSQSSCKNTPLTRISERTY